MTASEQVEQVGFSYVRDYKCPCGARYKIYTKSDLAGIELRLKYSGNVIKVYKNGREIGAGSYSTVEKLLLNAVA